jgi:hypothetical protein
LAIRRISPRVDLAWRFLAKLDLLSADVPRKACLYAVFLLAMGALLAAFLKFVVPLDQQRIALIRVPAWSGPGGETDQALAAAPTRGYEEIFLMLLEHIWVKPRLQSVNSMHFLVMPTSTKKRLTTFITSSSKLPTSPSGMTRSTFLPVPL